MTGLRNETYELFLNRGDGAFVDASASTGLLKLSLPWSGWGCGLVDLDNDGWLDLFVACGGLDRTRNNRIEFSEIWGGNSLILRRVWVRTLRQQRSTAESSLRISTATGGSMQP